MKALRQIKIVPWGEKPLILLKNKTKLYLKPNIAVDSNPKLYKWNDIT